MNDQPAAPFPPASMVTAEAAAYIGRDAKTLSNWRALGIGPAYVKTESRGVLYRRVDLDAWLEANLVTPSPEGARSR